MSLKAIVISSMEDLADILYHNNIEYLVENDRITYNNSFKSNNPKLFAKIEKYKVQKQALEDLGEEIETEALKHG